ncbi:MAG: hypothetical protein IPK03_10215 [Bacteroidetes bacterium]|nr:hypothetical protein [Bacteroidota bacterium]
MPSIKYILYIAFLCVMFYPLTMGSLYCDDVINFLHGKNTHSTWISKSIELSLHWIHYGRILILPQFTGSAINQFAHTVLQYKLVLFALNILATLFCYVYIKQLHNSISFGLFAFFYLGIIQYHMVFDGYHSFFGYYPILSILIYSCLFFPLKHQKTEKNTFYLASILLFFLLLLSGEIGLILPFVLIVQTFAFSSLNRNQFKKLMPYFGLSLLYIAATYYLRQHADMQTSYEGIQSNFDLFSMFRTWLIQLSAAIPLTSLYSRAAILQTLILTAQENWLLMVLVIMGMLGIVWMIQKKYSDIKSLPSPFFRLWGCKKFFVYRGGVCYFFPFFPGGGGGGEKKRGYFFFFFFFFF